MNQSTHDSSLLKNMVKAIFAVTLLAGAGGCAGYVDGGVYGGAVVTAPGPLVYGDFYDRGVDVHAYSHRGFASRGFAHGHVGKR